MSDTWSQVEGQVEEARAKAGIYRKWSADGESHVLAFRGEPYARQTHWTGTSYDECADQGCAHCAAGNKASLRVALNVYDLAEKKMMIVEGGVRWFSDIVKVRKKYGLDTWAFEVTRNGAPRDPKTTYSILPDHKLDEAALREIGAVHLHDLARDVADAAREAYADEIAEAANQATGPVATEVAREIHGLLRQCSKAEVEGFLKTFGIERVSQLKTSDEKRARAYVADLQELLPF